MSRVTRFAGRDPGATARMAGFLAHVRENGLRLGVQETEAALSALTFVEAAEPNEARRALKAVCTGCKDDAQQFDALFDSFWMDAGRVRTKVMPKSSAPAKGDDSVHSSRDAKGEDAGGAGDATAPEAGQGEAESDGEGKLIATEMRNLSRRDLRDLVRPEEIAEAEEVARRLGLALRDRRSRRDGRSTIRRLGRRQPWCCDIWSGM